MYSYSYNINFNGCGNPFMSYNPRMNFFLGMASGFAGLSMPMMPMYPMSCFCPTSLFSMNAGLFSTPFILPKFTMPEFILPQGIEDKKSSVKFPSLTLDFEIQKTNSEKAKKSDENKSNNTENKKSQVKVSTNNATNNNTKYNSNALPEISNSKIMRNVPKARKEKILDCVDRACKQYNVDPKLVISLMCAESGFNPQATSRCGAAGLMQLMPATAKAYGASDPYDIEQNIFAGTKFLKYLLNRYNGNKDLAIAAYNAGPGKVHDSIPNIRETKNHVAKVNKNMASLA